MKTIGIIPARYGSSRLPGKPLKDICGKPMIQHVYERACLSELIEKVVVATDDRRIVDAVLGFGGEAVLTSSSHVSGSDRIAEVARDIDCEIVVNIQGDEPLIQPQIIDEITRELAMNPDVVMATGCYQILDQEMYNNTDVVKVVLDKNNDALYFSRSLIPYPRNKASFAAYEHLGIYVYTKEFLMKYIMLDNSPLCETESLEQLKVLENGYKLRVVKTKYDYNGISVDTQEDLDRVKELLTEG